MKQNQIRSPYPINCQQHDVELTSKLKLTDSIVCECSNRPQNSVWTQQKFEKWTPLITLTRSIVFCMGISLSCFTLGLSILLVSSRLREYRVIYDSSTKSLGHINMTSDGQIGLPHNCILNTPKDANSFHAKHTCYIQINIDHEPIPDAPWLLFYEITGFHQNHRRFVTSIEQTQLTDEWLPQRTSYELGNWQRNTISCEPLETISSHVCHVGNCDHMEEQQRKLYPCGIVANTMFNDIFWLHNGTIPTGETLSHVDIVMKNIARTYPSHTIKNPSWDISNDYLPVWQNPNFSRIIPPVSGNLSPHITSDYTNSTAWVVHPLDPIKGPGVGLENEHFRTWIEIAASYSPIRKPYGRISKVLTKNTVLTFAVQSNFYVGSFNGSKAIVLTQISWFGSANHALGIVYISLSVIFCLASIVFSLRKYQKPRVEGDASGLQWKALHKSSYIL